MSGLAYRALELAISHLEPKLAEAFFKAIWVLRSQADVDSVTQRLENGDVEGALAEIFDDPDTWGHLAVEMLDAIADAAHGTLAADFAAALTTAAPAAAQAGLANNLPPSGVDPAQLQVMFPDPRFTTQIDDTIGAMIQQIDEQTRGGVRAYIERSLAAGKNPADLITELVGRVQADGSREGGIIGLTDKQANAVLNYRDALENRSMSALQRALRDRRFDASVRANAQYLSDGSLNPAFQPLDDETIDNLVNRYEGRMLAYRAETISRTEAMRAQRTGQQVAWDATIADGKVSADDLCKTWWTAGDDRVRPAHRLMEQVTIPYNDYFDTEDLGPIPYPEAINCRCILFYQPIWALPDTLELTDGVTPPDDGGDEGDVPVDDSEDETAV